MTGDTVILTAEERLKAIAELANLGNLIDRDGIAISEGDKKDMAKDRRKVIIGWQEDGTPITKDIRGNSFDEVNVKIATALIESGRMNDVIGRQFNFLLKPKEECKVTLSEYVRKYVDTYLKRSIKDSSLRLYGKYEKLIGETIGKEPLSSINTERLQEFFNSHTDMCESTLKKIRGFISPIFDCAVEEGIIDRNPVSSKRIRIKGVAEKSPDAISTDNIQKVLTIIDSLPIKHRKMLVLLLFTGVRRGEMLGLQWRDIDTVNGVIHIRRQVKHVGNRPIVDNDLKTVNGKRDIPIIGDIKVLLSLKGSDADTDYIVSGSEPMTQKMYENAWQHTIKRRILEVTGLENVTAHQLRHTFITYLESTRIDPKTLSAIAGHSDVAFTLKRYVSIQPEKILEAGQKIEDVFNGLKLAQ